MTYRLDDADLVLIGAAALGVDPDELVDRIDVASLAHITARTESVDTEVDLAASVLVGIVQRRPFPSGNEAAAWLGAAHVLQSSGYELIVTDDEIIGLFDRAVDENEVAKYLAGRIRPRPSRVRRLLRWLWTAEQRLDDSMPSLRRPHRTPIAEEVPGPQPCPVVVCPSSTDGRPFMAITPDGPLVFFTTVDDEDRFDVVRPYDLSAGAMVGDWRRLREQGEFVARVAVADVPELLRRQLHVDVLQRQ